ncbi:hypothetical protein A9Q99_18015 [Gammaproteobacteria bacterium 45_16_T64]|nr:hypothetical protein A9Q99_18015 [Gammaproteobacteria bacterium 45_16_T64]
MRQGAVPCPRCGKYIFDEELECPHCDYKSRDIDIFERKEYAEKERRNGRVYAVLFMPAALILVTAVLSVILD